MVIAGIILSSILLLYWLITVDASVSFAPAVSCGVLKLKTFRSGMVIVAVTTLILMWLGVIPLSDVRPFPEQSPVSLIVASVSAFITLLIVNKISHFSSICYAFISGLYGCSIFSTGHIEVNEISAVFASWIVAPICAIILGALIYVIYTATVGKSNAHLMRFSEAMKFVVLIGSILLAFAFALNNGQVLLMISEAVDINRYLLVAVMIVLIISLFVFLRKRITNRVYELLDAEFDINFSVAISITFSSALVLLLFSSNRMLSFIGLRAAPISVPFLLFFSLLGIGFVQNMEKLEIRTLLKMLLSFVATILIAPLLAYLFCLIIGRDILSAPIVTGNMAHNVVDYNLIVFSALALLSVATLIIIDYRQKVKEENKCKALFQQQQQYENSSILDAIEVKAILAENEGLYNRLEGKRKELVDVALNISEQREFYGVLYNKLKNADAMKDGDEKNSALKEIEQMLFQRMTFRQEMDGFYLQAEKLHKDFSIKLKESFPNLTEQEKKLATLLRLGFSTKEIASLMNISVKSGEISRYRLRKKLNLKQGDNLIQFIKSL